MNPPRDNTAIPLKADPLVHPLPSCDPNPKRTPPVKARRSRFFEVIFGECSTLSFRRPANAPERNPPTRTPVISKTSQVFIGFPGCSSLNSFTKPDFSDADGAIVVTAPTTVLFMAPLAPKPRPETKFEASRTNHLKAPSNIGIEVFCFLCLH